MEDKPSYEKGDVVILNYGQCSNNAKGNLIDDCVPGDIAVVLEKEDIPEDPMNVRYWGYANGFGWLCKMYIPRTGDTIKINGHPAVKKVLGKNDMEYWLYG